MVADNIKAGILTLFLGSIGDLASRSMWLNCSVDKAWTLLFALPPFSIVSAMMHFLNKIQKGSQSCVSSIDSFLLLIPIFTILMSVLMPMFIENNMISTMIIMLFVFLLFMGIRMYKSYETCNIQFASKNPTFNMSHIKRALIVSLCANGGILLFNTLAPFGELIPVIGVGFKAWGFLELIPGLQHSLLLILVHFVMNMHDNLEQNMQNVCFNT